VLGSDVGVLEEEVFEAAVEVDHLFAVAGRL